MNNNLINAEDLESSILGENKEFDRWKSHASLHNSCRGSLHGYRLFIRPYAKQNLQ